MFNKVILQGRLTRSGNVCNPKDDLRLRTIGRSKIGTKSFLSTALLLTRPGKSVPSTWARGLPVLFPANWLLKSGGRAGREKHKHRRGGVYFTPGQASAAAIAAATPKPTTHAIQSAITQAIVDQQAQQGQQGQQESQGFYSILNRKGKGLYGKSRKKNARSSFGSITNLF